MPELELPQTYHEIAALITEKIASGEYPVGSILPSGRQLAAEYGVAVATIQRAMGLLHERGLVVGRQGRGQYVRGISPG